MVVGLDLGVPLREVAHVDERLARVRRGDDELVEESAGAAAELRHVDLAVGDAVRVPDGVGSALGDPREQRLRGQRPLDGRVRTEAESRYAAHEPLFDSVDRTTPRT